MNNIFKAGDFTSGKMGDIFKQCYLHRIAIINHKQFGQSYMIPKESFKTLALNELLKIDGFLFFVQDEFAGDTDGIETFKQADDEECFNAIDDFFNRGFFEIDDYLQKNWFDVFSFAVMYNGGACDYVENKTV